MTELLSLPNLMRVGKLSLLSVCFIGAAVGCSSRLQTTIMSGAELPPKSQVAKVEPLAPPTEEAVQTAVPAAKDIGVPPIDIPVEDPARPVIRPSGPADIFATPRTGGVEPSVPAPVKAPLVAEPVASPPPVIAGTPSQPALQEQPKMLGIPPISFEPEQPTLPTIREEAASSEKLIARVEPHPVQESVSMPQPPIEEKIIEEPVEQAPILQEPVQESVSVPQSPIEEKPIEPVEQASTPQEPVQMAKVVPAAPEKTVESRMEEALKTLEDIYFDYDRFTIRKDAIPVLQENAQALVAGLSDKNIVIEGHCDQRGTESYNMVLGERRANAVKEFLVDLGVPSDKLQVMSYGKEKPFCTDQTEQCWQENRRGHFVLK